MTLKTVGEWLARCCGRVPDETQQLQRLLDFVELMERRTDGGRRLYQITPKNGGYQFTMDSGKKGGDVKVIDSNVGIINTGDLENVGEIHSNISTISASGGSSAAEALQHLTDGVSAANQVSKEQREELIGIIKFVSNQAAMPQEKRESSSFLKTTLVGLGQTLSAIGGLAEIWGTWGGSLMRHFSL